MQIETIDEGRSHQRVMRIDGEEVCHLWVIDHTMRIGGAHVRMAGIGDVYTNRAHRMKGYMRQLYVDTVSYMTDQGYEVSMLFGIPNFYTKFGYASSIPTVHFAIKTRDAEAAGDAAPGDAAPGAPVPPTRAASSGAASKAQKARSKRRKTRRPARKKPARTGNARSKDPFGTIR